MSAFSRNKGKAGEREVCRLIQDLLGINATRRVRQHGSDSDILGVNGWSIEVKNAAEQRLSEWWRQTVEQSGPDVPALFYKVPRKGWRVRWPLAILLVNQRGGMWSEEAWTADTTPEAWAAVVREMLP